MIEFAIVVLLLITLLDCVISYVAIGEDCRSTSSIEWRELSTICDYASGHPLRRHSPRAVGL